MTQRGRHGRSDGSDEQDALHCIRCRYAIARCVWSDGGPAVIVARAGQLRRWPNSEWPYGDLVTVRCRNCGVVSMLEETTLGELVTAWADDVVIYSRQPLDGG